MSHAEWLPAVAIVAAGVIVGIILWRTLTSRRGPAASEDLDYADLVARRDTLLEQIRETPDPALELEAAKILRDLDQLQAKDAGTRRLGDAREALSFASPRPRVSVSSSTKGFLWGAGTVGALALVIFLVTRSTSERKEGGSLTGGGPPQNSATDSDLAQLQQTVERNPENLDARLDLAQALLARERLMEVFEQTQFVLERQPNHPRALSYQALVRLAMGQAETALQMLEQALSQDPDSIEARVHLALVYATMGDTKAAENTLQETMRRHPAEAGRLTGLLEQIRAGAGGAGSAPARSADRVELVVDLAPGKQVARNALLFVVARPEGVSEGAPIAAKRMAASSFPVTVSLGPEDSMMGGKLTDKLRIDVRVDSDGDPLTRNATDPVASVDGVTLGATGVRLVLR